MATRDMLYNLSSIDQCFGGLCRAKETNIMIPVSSEERGKKTVFGFLTRWKTPDNGHDVIKLFA